MHQALPFEFDNNRLKDLEAAFKSELTVNYHEAPNNNNNNYVTESLESLSLDMQGSNGDYPLEHLSAAFDPNLAEHYAFTPPPQQQQQQQQQQHYPMSSFSDDGLTPHMNDAMIEQWSASQIPAPTTLAEQTTMEEHHPPIFDYQQPLYYPVQDYQGYASKAFIDMLQDPFQFYQQNSLPNPPPSAAGPARPRSHRARETRSESTHIYVRKACVLCKASHVACDVQRPCTRCRRLNKEDACVDAERKKRGRPCGSTKKKTDETSEEFRQDTSSLMAPHPFDFNKGFP
ncbi:hypothetical protein BCR43DRAFT_551857 [Syncephalastrum racemosum]|uniref:Zn(2)-C6 fungal-type domain-containing protein n=1 Tax=Syncephalastrum racemosum TaxID=13706 RepID=A0A1X2H6H2_SYNRA|nr:hypothetical protein BCR43DRAFT_551857 [Syncephalastrum racemosum]